MSTVVKPCSWFRKGEKVDGTSPGAIIQPHGQETEALLEERLCNICRHFRYEQGQELIRKSWFIEMLKQDYNLSNLAEGVDPRELGACDAQEGLVTHRFSGQKCEMFEKQHKLFAGVIRRCRGR